MKESDSNELREKLIGLGKTSMRKNYYAELLKEKQKLEEQNLQLLQEVQQRREAEAALLALNDELETRIHLRTNELEKLNHDLNDSYVDLKQAHEYLVQTEKLAALGSLVAGISHEVNTPLGICMTISTYLMTLLTETRQLFMDKKLTAVKFNELSLETLNSSQIMVNNLMRSVELLENFKLIAVDQSHYEYRTFRFKDYTQRILSNLQPEIKKKNVEIVISCEDSLEIKGYPGILTQILSNLVINSLIHGFPTLAPYQIKIAYRVDADTIYMDYSDNGHGMTQEQAQRAFEPFFTTKLGTGGSGLGLFIVYNLVSVRLKGTITLDTSPGKGVHFRIKVPLNHQMEQKEE